MCDRIILDKVYLDTIKEVLKKTIKPINKNTTKQTNKKVNNNFTSQKNIAKKMNTNLIQLIRMYCFLFNNCHIKPNNLAVSTKKKPLVCPDQYVAIVKIKKFCNRTSVKYLENNIQNCHNRKIEINNKYKSIVIILESPHDKEFDFNNNVAIGPAVGKTGENFSKWFCETMLKSMIINRCKSGATQKKKSKIKSGIYNIVFMNAIQYQCSLGEETSSFRDQIFSKMWEKPEVKDCFKNRLKLYKPNMIINCCTGGKSKSKGSRLVEDYLKTIDEKIDLYMEGAHPSSAYFLEGFEIKSL